VAERIKLPDSSSVGIRIVGLETFTIDPFRVHLVGNEALEQLGAMDLTSPDDELARSLEILWAS
jgi:hypothetical protein